jgi:mannose-6-phosphate isomerase-like protein (cupin superfamily)
MRIERPDPNKPKGWYAGPGDSGLDISIGYANEGVDEPHLHRRMTEVYFIARGTAEMRVENLTVILREGDAVIVEPGEAHTFLWSSPDYFHLVIHTPGLTGDDARADKVAVPRSRLGL